MPHSPVCSSPSIREPHTPESCSVMAASTPGATSKPATSIVSGTPVETPAPSSAGANYDDSNGISHKQWLKQRRAERERREAEQQRAKDLPPRIKAILKENAVLKRQRTIAKRRDEAAAAVDPALSRWRTAVADSEKIVDAMYLRQTAPMFGESV